MSPRVPLILILGLLASCDSPVEAHRLPPPTLSLSAELRIMPGPQGPLQLEIAATLRNDTQVAIGVSTGPSCPLQSHLFLDPSGEPMAVVPFADAPCAPDPHLVTLEPGDSTRLVQIWTADTLATFAPGTYGTSVMVTTSTAIIGKWAGAVTLPLATSP